MCVCANVTHVRNKQAVCVCVCVCGQLKAVVEKAEQDDSSLATAPVLPLTQQVLRQVVGPLAVARLVVGTCVCGFHF